MGVRPPSNDTDDEPDIIEFGIAALDARVEEWGLSFPVSKSELEAVYGNEKLAVDPSGNEITLGEALEACDRQSFDSKQELLNTLHPVFERKREKLSGGILGRVRSLLPF